MAHKETDKRLIKDGGFAKISELPKDSISYKVQDIVSKDGAPSELKTIHFLNINIKYVKPSN